MSAVGDAVDEIKGSDSREMVYAKLNAALEKDPHIGEHAVDKNGRTPYIRAVLHKDPNIFVAEWLEDSHEHRAHGRRWHKTSPGLKRYGYNYSQNYDDSICGTALAHAASFPDAGEAKADNNIADVRRKFLDRILAKRFPHDRIANYGDNYALVEALKLAIIHKNNYFVQVCRQKFPSVTAGHFYECKYAVEKCQPDALEKIYEKNPNKPDDTIEAITRAIVFCTLDAYQAKALNSDQAKSLLDIAKKRYPHFKQKGKHGVDQKTQLENIERLCFQFRDHARQLTANGSAHILQETTAWYARDILENAIKHSAVDTKMIEDLYPYLDFTVFGDRCGSDKAWNANYWEKLSAAIIPCFERLDDIKKFIDKIIHDLSMVNEKDSRQEPKDVLGYICTAAQQLESNPSCSIVVLSYLAAIRSVLKGELNSTILHVLSDQATIALSVFFSTYAKDLPEAHAHCSGALLGYSVNQARKYFGPNAQVKTLFPMAPPGQQEESKQVHSMTRGLTTST